MAVYDLDQLLAKTTSLSLPKCGYFSPKFKENINIWLRSRIGLFLICTVGIFLLFLCFKSGAGEHLTLFLPAHFGLFIFRPGKKTNLEKLAAQMCDFLVCQGWAQSRCSQDIHGLSKVFVKGLFGRHRSIISQCPMGFRSFQFSVTDAGCWWHMGLTVTSKTWRLQKQGFR